MKRLVVFALIVLFAGSAAYFGWSSLQPSIVGVWKGVDEYGHEHYFEFRRDGTLVWWDRDRTDKETFTERPRFSGSYRYENRRTILATSDGFPPQPLGILTLVSEDELQQSGCHAARDTLLYTRVR
jgi:hypothetical protein